MQKVAQIRSSLEQQLTQAILTSQNPQEALTSLSQLIGQACHAEGCIIMPQPRSPTASPSYWLDESANFKDAPFRDRLLDLLKQLVNDANWTEGVLAIGNLQTVRSAYAVEPLYSQSVLIVRTQFQGETNGAIAIVQSQPHRWQDSDVDLLQSLSPQVAMAISQAHLEHQLQQQVRYQKLIDQLTTAIRNAWELDELFKFAVKGTASALEVSRGLLLLFKYNDPLHRSRSSGGVPHTKAHKVAEWLALTPAESEFSEAVFWASDCRICRQVLAGSLDPVVVPVGELNQLSSDEWGTQLAPVFLTPLLRLQPSHALLLMPLENQGTVLGCLILQQDQPRLWSTEELSFVKLAAAQLSTAIIQTRTLKQIQSVVQERTAQLQHSLDVQAKLYEKSRQQVELLRRLNEEREEFLSTVSHELRTPLTSMTLAIRMLRQANLSADRQTKYLNILEQQCAQETNLINDLLALRKLESNQVNHQIQKTDVRYLIQGAAQAIEPIWAERNLTLTLDLPDAPVNLFTDPDSLNRVLLELLTNAGKYSESGTTVELKLTHQLSSPQNQVVLSLRNWGDGILPEELPHIFEKFRRGEGMTQRAIQGTGLGLALVKGLVEHLNGTIAVTSQPQATGIWETCFILSLPHCHEGMIGIFAQP